MEIIKKVDELGRIVLPKDLRDSLKINANDYIKFTQDGFKIILEKYAFMDKINEENADIITSFCDLMDDIIYITDNEKIITKGPIFNEKIPIFMKELLQNRKTYQSQSIDTFFGQSGYFYIMPLIKDSNAIGLCILLKLKPFEKEDLTFAKLLSAVLIK